MDRGVRWGAVWSHVRGVVAHVIDNYRVWAVMPAGGLAVQVGGTVVLAGWLAVRVGGGDRGQRGRWSRQSPTIMKHLGILILRCVR